MNTKLLTRLAVSAMVLGLFGGVGHASAQDLDKASFSYVGSWGNLNLYNQFEKPFWEVKLEELSDGKLSAKARSFDQMGVAGADVYQFLARGVFDIGTTVVEYAGKDTSAIDVIDLPLLALSVEDAKKAAAGLRPYVSDIFKERYQGAKVLAIVPYSPTALFCKKPVSGLNDLKGRKIRAGGAADNEVIQAIGATPINISFSEVVGALQHGVIDCAITGPIDAYSASWHEVADYLYLAPLGGWDFTVTAVNGKKWGALSAETQKWLEQTVATHYEEPVWTDMDYQIEQGVNCLSGQGKCDYGKPASMQVVHFADADAELARSIIEEKVLPKWAGYADQKWVTKWNETVGKEFDLEAK